MSKTHEEFLRLVLIDDNADLNVTNSSGELLFPPSKFGRTISDDTEIKPELIGDGYCVTYRISVFETLNLEQFITSLSNLFDYHRPGIDIVIDISSVRKKGDEDRYDHAAEEFVDALNHVDPDNLSMDNAGDDDEDDEDDDELVGESISHVLSRAFGGINIDDDDYDRRYKSKSKSKSNRKDFPSSRSLKNGKHPKRDINRHNIIIAGKKDYQRDAKIIKDFLRDFIPGKSGWIKDYRKEVLERWLGAYAIKEKEARHRKQEYQKSIQRKTVNSRMKTISGITGAIAHRYNPFYDPAK